MRRDPSTRRRAEEAGRWAERLAALWLMAKGYRLLARRLRTPMGELDLVMARGRVVAFVEVKARPLPTEAVAAISPRQRRRIERAAAWFMARRAHATARFDVVAISPWRWPRHLKNAWLAGD